MRTCRYNGLQVHQVNTLQATGNSDASVGKGSLGWGIANGSPLGFLNGFMEHVNESYPHPDHSVNNMAAGGSAGEGEASCLHSYIPMGEYDLVTVDRTQAAIVVKVEHSSFKLLSTVNERSALGHGGRGA